MFKNMNIKSIFFPFAKKYSFLEKNWWHRLFIVIYLLVISIFFLLSFVIVSENISEKVYNTTVKDNLRNFSKNSEKDITNTVPIFLKYGAKVGCLENDKITQISNYFLDENSFCSPDIPNRIDDASKKLSKNASLSIEDTKVALLSVVAKDTEVRYCFLNKNLNCSSDKIVSYNKSFIYYLEILLYPLLLTYLTSLLVQILYFKGLMYVIFGKIK